MGVKNQAVMLSMLASGVLYSSRGYLQGRWLFLNGVSMRLSWQIQSWFCPHLQ